MTGLIVRLQFIVFLCYLVWLEPKNETVKTEQRCSDKSTDNPDQEKIKTISSHSRKEKFSLTNGAVLYK